VSGKLKSPSVEGLFKDGFLAVPVKYGEGETTFELLALKNEG